MNILLVNPNRYRTPAVPPLALECLENALKRSRHGCRILDLCFSDDPAAELRDAVEEYAPDVAGITVRNIDTVIYDNNVFFLDEIRSLVDVLKERGVPVVAGGAGFSFIPEGILDYLGADWGVSGPGEEALIRLLDGMEDEPPPRGTILDGWEYGFDPDMPMERGASVDYERYIGEGGLAGFQTQKGCNERCSYCSEGNGRVLFRNPERIVEELGMLADRGVTRFHLCDTEFNQDLEFCRSFLERLVRKGPSLNIAVYMKTYPYDDDLFRLLKRGGVEMITLSVPTGRNPLAHAEEIVRLAADHGIRIAVDLLVGLPGETPDYVRRVIHRLREIGPDTVGVNSTIRLYPQCSVTRTILESEDYRQYLLGAVEDNPELVRPVFYRYITVDMLRGMIGDDPLFRIEGFERTSNYQRLGGGTGGRDGDGTAVTPPG